LHADGNSWTAVADALGISKQMLTGFLKGRATALDAEAILRMCTTWKLPLTFDNQTISCSTGSIQVEDSPALRLEMEFDDSFELQADPTPRAILTRKPPNRVSYIGIRIKHVGDGG